MPIYEYRCDRCEQLSEFFLRVSDPHPEACPRCGERGSLKKQISQTSFSLKGEGWYVTDYKKDKAPPNAAEKKAEPEGTEKSAEAKKEGESAAPAAGETAQAAPAQAAPAPASPAAAPAPAPTAKKDP
jgi:putative FmdB family regulatory protein